MGITDKEGYVFVEHPAKKIPSPALSHVGATKILIAKNQRIVFAQD